MYIKRLSETKVTDSAGVQLAYDGASDFVDAASSSTEYTYNSNGALTKDLNRGINSIEYDLLGNVQRINFSGNRSIQYVYSADGRRLRTIHSKQTTAQTLVKDSIDYVGNLILKDGHPSQYLFDGGYASFSNDALNGWHYYIQDYMGNNRMVVNRNGNTEQITHYYPYGGVIGGISTNETLQAYKFEGKELDRTFGLDTYDVHARNYFAMLPMWDRVDPLAEKNSNVTPYSYCSEDPVNRCDLDGMDWKDDDGNVIQNTENIKVFIFYSSDFVDQAQIQYNEAVKKYGVNSVAMSLASSTGEFVADWRNMCGLDIANVLIMTHGKNQSIAMDDGSQFTSTGDGRTNLKGQKAANIQDLPMPIGNISNAILNMYSCHSADSTPQKHGKGVHKQGDLKGSKYPIAYAFAKSFDFSAVIGTTESVNYHSFMTDFTPKWSNNYLKPYPANGGKWTRIIRK